MVVVPKKASVLPVKEKRFIIIALNMCEQITYTL